MLFTKMQGAGNDYIYVDCFSQSIPPDPAALARAVSDRHFGIGADGLILICPVDGADAEMRMFNADGSYSEMCGNGIRCVAKFVHDHGIAVRDQLKITSAGKPFLLDLELRAGKVERVRVDMGEPILTSSQIPTTLPGDPPVDAPFEVAGRTLSVTCVSMGNPHCVTYVDSATDELVLGVGPQIETDPRFPKRTNVEFIEVLNRETVRQRTWERGSGETLACGTGACAVCVAGVLTGRTDRRITSKLLGGDLQLEWDEATNHVFMTGPATEVFTGDWLG
ncbi:diaminopimelate epimerase [Lacipirellula limnantheis]|uniref:Diaminopimelate epimerase n=1 Tax=Lacipirellula limnantheis TaxID=2528024 RepID=A0A517U1C9_9BACT|nr:diaminopimelate epimerase [Lacipirellula limnantheis]QDT74417.1 Diaminopimelate epimerase [Lacipirellula limnantheis]